MKKVKALFSVLMLFVVLFASPVSAEAIGFDAETVYESVFVIYSANSMGSGFAIGENCIVTNAHVIDNEDDIIVMTYSGTEYRASVIGISTAEDIAVLAVRGAQFPFLSIADESAMKTGDDIYAIGAPKGMAYTLTKGSISAKSRMIGYRSYIQIDAPINEGNSGGPLLNDAGEVLGMNTMKMSDSEGIGLAIPASRICDYVESLGVVLGQDGNVDEDIGLSDEPVLPTESEDEVSEDANVQNSSDKTIVYILTAVAGVSLIVNIILAVLLAKQKKPNNVWHADPSERTDFEIDIWD